jgi:hypothetical protein
MRSIMLLMTGWPRLVRSFNCNVCVLRRWYIHQDQSKVQTESIEWKCRRT